MQELSGIILIFLNVGENVTFRTIENISSPCSPLILLTNLRSLGMGPMYIFKSSSGDSDIH